MTLVNVNGVDISYEVTGEGRPVVLLHGFPDSGRIWRNQVPVLAEAGFQVIVPDLRGCGRSGKPGAVEAYALSESAKDVHAVLADLGIDRAHIVGHDWGAALAWTIALNSPGTVDHLAVLSVGHPATFMRTTRQHEKSWYMLLFLFPGVAERWLSENDWANTRNWPGHPDVEGVIAEFEEMGTLTSGLNWYRANVPVEYWVDPPRALPPVKTPTMGIWSTNDIALTEAQMLDTAEYMALRSA
jgi:pimeloyl-ACP methyl ester carboxylesterase